jgi:hypothetical protein
VARPSITLVHALRGAATVAPDAAIAHPYVLSGGPR